MKELTTTEYASMIEGRRKLEVSAAQKIGEYLGSTHMAYIRRLLHHILTKIMTINRVRLNEILSEQTSYMMWSECSAAPSVDGLESVRDYLWRRDGGEKWLCVCSDLIRLFGEVAEIMVKTGHPDGDLEWQNIDNAKSKLRPEPVYAKPKRNEFGYYKDTDRGWGHRDRSNKENIVKIGHPFVYIPRENVKWRGVERFSFGERSVIDVIDWTYGLPVEGANISGTTTDSIAALRWADKYNQVNPIAQLIAIATMVPQGHHSIVECAWPLTRHGYMNYVIGFYETLIPDDAGDYGKLKPSLESLNNDSRNRHVLAYLREGKEIKMEFNTQDEINAYKRIAGVRTAYGFCVAGKPYYNSVIGLLEGKKIPANIINNLH